MSQHHSLVIRSRRCQEIGRLCVTSNNHIIIDYELTWKISLLSAGRGVFDTSGAR